MPLLVYGFHLLSHNVLNEQQQKNFDDFHFHGTWSCSKKITNEISEANKRVYPLDYLKVLLPTA